MFPVRLYQHEESDYRARISPPKDKGSLPQIIRKTNHRVEKEKKKNF